MRALREERGQVIAIYAFGFLLIALMTMLTVAVGVRVREKIKAEAAADAAAYGLAVSEARTMNIMAWTNRAIISEYVSMLSVEGHESYMNEWEQVINGQVSNWSSIKSFYKDLCEATLTSSSCPGGPCPGACGTFPLYCPCCGCPYCYCSQTAGYISDMWKDFPMGGYTVVHAIWHEAGMPFHMALTAMENDYVSHAQTARDQAGAAYGQYHTYLINQVFAEKSSQAVDPNFLHDADDPTGKSASVDQFKKAVQAAPGAPELNAIAPKNWDVYHEILTGTRTDWILNHTWNSGYYDLMYAAQEILAIAGCAFGDSTVGDEGGSMTLGKGKSQVETMNHSAPMPHSYDLGSGNEGGRAASAGEDHGESDSFALSYPGCFGPIPDSESAGGLAEGDNYMFQAPTPCKGTAYHKAGDGWNDGDFDSSANHIWPTPINGIINAGCATPGITVGWFRYALPPATPAAAGEKVLWNQPRVYASVKLPIPKGPWDLDLGTIDGSALKVQGSKFGDKNATDAITTNGRDGSESMSGKGYVNGTKLFPMVRGLGTGMAYYHNPLNWKEIPSLWNPFWRAKLDKPFNAQVDLKQLANNQPDDNDIATHLGF